MCDFAGEIPGIMKSFLILFALFAIGNAGLDAETSDDICFGNIVEACSSTQTGTTAACNAKYGGITYMQHYLQRYVNHLIYRSFDFLLMSTYYGNYIKNRPGFAKLFRNISDSHWENAVDLIEYIDVRGGQMNFNNLPAQILDSAEILQGEMKADGGNSSWTKLQANWELNEVEALAEALDLEKELDREVFYLHMEAEDRIAKHYDPEIANYLEAIYVDQFKANIRKLSGYTNDLVSIVNTKDASLGVYLFDEYLQKQD